MSSYLIKQLDRHPLLYYSVEEAVECAKIGYFGIGIMAFAQLLNVMNEKTPESRHLVGHEFLKRRPTKADYESVAESFKNAAAERSDQECRKSASGADYEREIRLEWEAFIKKLHDLDEIPTAQDSSRSN